MNVLYHGTLAKNLPSIRQQGLLPRRGQWTSEFQPTAEFFVYAVDENQKGKLATILFGQIIKAQLVTRVADYQFWNFKMDFVEHAAVLVIKSTGFKQYLTRSAQAHPAGMEPDDWYRNVPVVAADIERTMVGEEMFGWLSPGEQDFKYRWRNLLQERLGVSEGRKAK